MMSGLIWLIGCYGLGMVMVHGVHRWAPQGTNPPQRYVIMTRNNQTHVEWCLRSIVWISRFQNKAIAIDLLDLGSDDDTLRIAAVINREWGVDLQIHPKDGEHDFDSLCDKYKDNALIIVRLHLTNDGKHMPAFQWSNH